MQIITGLNQHYKRNHIIQKYVQKANQHPFHQYIYICDNPHVIEQYFFQYTHCLVNIQNHDMEAIFKTTSSAIPLN